MAIYTAPQPWQGRNDGEQLSVQRWHQAIILLDVEAAINYDTMLYKIAIIGFCSDEGVRRNLGRVGAKDGPAAIRKACSSFPVHFESLLLFDAGDVHCNDGDLEAAQQLLAEKVQVLTQYGYFPIVLGGGHEVAYANYSGIRNKLLPNSSFGIINFDAHFDLRAIDPKVGATSGTGFWQMAQDCTQHNLAFNYLAIGIQDCCNTKVLFDTARNIGTLYIKAESFTNDQLEHTLDYLNHVINISDTVQLTIDMDVFTASSAPGVSAPAFNGIPPNAMFKRLLRHIIFSKKLASIDIAEVNPEYDIDNRTSRLAASFLFDMVQALELA